MAMDNKYKDSVLWNKTVECVGRGEDLLTEFRNSQKEWEQVYQVFEQEHRAIDESVKAAHVAYLNAQEQLDKLNELRTALFAFKDMADTNIDGQNEWQYIFHTLGLKVTVRIETTDS